MAKSNTSILLVLTIFLLVFTASLLFAGDWEKVDVPLGNTLYSVHFVDANNGWAVGESGAIIHTSDGETWQKQDSPMSDLILYDVYFVDAQNGWAVGGAPLGMAAPGKNIKLNRQQGDNSTFYVIIHTEDGGESWDIQTNDEGLSVLKGVCFVDANNGWAVGSRYVWNALFSVWEERTIVLRTSDSGLNWQGGDIPLVEGGFVVGRLNGVHFVDAQKGWVVGGGVDALGKYFSLLYTENGGLTWLVNAQYGPIRNDVHFTDSPNGWLAAENSIIDYTRDGGQNWNASLVDAENSITLNGVHFITPQEGWTVGKIDYADTGVIYSTKDGGATWEQETIPESGILFDVHDAGEASIWTVGESGSVWKRELVTPPSVFTVTNLNDSGNGSLRWAIEQTNANPDVDTINFSVSGTISPTSALPAITDDGIVIGASSQWIGTWPSGQPGITLDGSGAGGTGGLIINGAANCHIRGLFIRRFAQGIVINNGGKFNTVGGIEPGYRNVISGNQDGVIIGDSNTNNNTVSGNYIGTDATGTAALGNSESGVTIIEDARANTIGGTTEGERNIISGNGGGVWLSGSGTDNNRVLGNYIGTDVTGTKTLGNREDGVGIGGGAQSNTVGGVTESARNIISGNSTHGMLIYGSGTNNNVVSGNYIGTDVTGNAKLGNTWSGVYIMEGAQSNIIGDTSNMIAFNGDSGIKIYDAGTHFNKISRNSIYDNTKLGIDLVDGGNDEITPPSITSNNLVGNTLTLSGNGAGANATVEVFEADSSTSGEGKTYLGSLPADGSGNFSGNIDVTGKGLSVDAPLVVTTTHTDNNTSEFGTLKDASATLTLSRTEGFVGDIVKAFGSGYAENSVIGKLTFDGSVISDLTAASADSVIEGQINSDVAGAFEVTFEIPKHIGGTFAVEVDGVQANLRIKARIVISPEKGAAETEITVSGDGFTQEKITIDFGETKEITSSDANVDGSFTATFNADEQALGVEKIKATGTQSGQSAAADFELTESIQVISPKLSSLTTDTPKVGANGFSEAIITITIRDEKGKPVKGARVTVFVTGSDYTFEPPKRTDANGVTTVNITSTKAERKMVSAVAEGVNIIDSVKIRFKPGEPSRLTLEANRDRIQADGESTITIKITVFDKHNNPVSSAENPLAIKTVDVEIEPVVGKVETPAKDNGDGTYNSTYTAGDRPGDIIITAWTSNGKSGETTISLTEVDRTAEITDLIVEGSPAKAGEKISVTLKGEAGGEATFALENVAENIRLEEGESGVYTGTYMVKEGDNILDAVLTITLKDALGNEDSDARAKVTLDTTPPPPPTDLNAPKLFDGSNQKNITISGKATPKKNITVKLMDENKKEIVESVESGDDGKFEVVVDASLLSDGIVYVTAQEESDAAGNVGTKSEFTATKDTTTKPDFVIKTIKGQKTARVGSTAVFIITVTGVNNFQAPVKLMPDLPPKGISFEFSQNNLTPSSADPMLYTQLTMTVGAEAKEGIYDIEVWGHSEGYPSKKVNLTLTVEKVKLTPILTIQMSKKEIPLGEKISISGSLITQEGQLPTNVNLTANYQKPSGNTVEQSHNTDDKNGYVFEYTPDKVGEWQVSVKWAGNDEFKEAVAQETFQVTKGNSAIQFDIDDKLSLGKEITIVAHLNPALPDETVNLRVITPPPDNITFASESLETNEYGRFEWSFTPPEEGDWTLKATYDGNENYEPAEMEFTLHVIGKQAKAIVVLGGGDKIENQDWKRFNAVAEYVYNTLLKRKFNPDDIYFLSTEKDITNGCDDRTSFDILESAITNWAKGRVDQHTPLYIYLLSHNRDDKFLLDIQDGENTILTAAQLDKWLDELPEEIKVTVIIEACYSGNFIKRLAARNRTIITSAVDTEKAYLLGNKSSFSKYFFDFIYRNKEIRAAFADTVDLMKNIPIHAAQNPQMDADWDGVPNEQDDFDEIAKVFLPKDTPSLADEIEILDITPAQTLPEGSTSATIQAKVKYASEITQVTAAIFQPEFDRETYEPAIVHLTFVGDGVYEFTYDDFNNPGRYVIQIHADNPGESAIPQATAITIPSPLSARIYDVNNDDVVDISDLVLVGKNFGTSSKIGDVNGDGRVNISDLVLVGKHFGAKW